MKVISIVNTKGGTGKSTIAVNLATMLAQMQYKVLLVDTDAKQNSSMSFCSVRTEDDSLADVGCVSIAEKTLYKDIAKFDNFDFVIIDAGAGDNNLVRAAILSSGRGMLIIPVQPSTYDFWATEDTLKLVAECRDMYDGYDKNYILVNRKPTNERMRIIKDTTESLQEVCKKYDVQKFTAEISDRVAFREAVGAGKNVAEFARGNKSGKKAAEEMRGLVNEILEVLK
jgi:chromosome partitioning protein